MKFIHYFFIFFLSSLNVSLYGDQQRSIEATTLACQMISAGDTAGLEKVLTNNSFSQSELTLLKHKITDIITPKDSNKTWQEKWQKCWNTASPTVMLMGTLIALFIVRDLQKTVGEAQNLTTLQLGFTHNYEDSQDAQLADEEKRNIPASILLDIADRQTFEEHIKKLDTSAYNAGQIQQLVFEYQRHRKNILLDIQSYEGPIVAKVLAKHFDVFTGNITDSVAAKTSHRLDGMNGAFNALSLCLKAKLVFDLASIWVQIKNYRKQRVYVTKLKAAQALVDKKLAEMD